MAKLELGIISGVWDGTPVGREEGMRKAKEIGFDSYDIFEDPLDLTTEEQAHIKELSEELDFPIRSCVCVNFALVDFNPSVQRFARERAQAYIRQAQLFGARNVVLVIGEYYWDDEVIPKDGVWQIAVDNVKALAADADAAGVDLVIELEPFTQALVKDVPELVRFVKDVDHPRVKANADISHLHLAKTEFSEVAQLTGLIGHVHLSDCDGEVHGDLPPGRGKTPIKEYLQAVIDTGLDDATVALELEYSPDPANIVSWVEEAYESSAKILDELGVRSLSGSAA